MDHKRMLSPTLLASCQGNSAFPEAKSHCSRDGIYVIVLSFTAMYFVQFHIQLPRYEERLEPT